MRAEEPEGREEYQIRFGARKRKGKPVLRLRGNKMKSTAFLGGAFGLALGLAIARFTGNPMFLLVAAMVGIVAGGILGAKREDDTCVGCDSSLARDATKCIRCNARVVGEITSMKERHDAEEKVRKARVAERKRVEAAGGAWKDPDEEDDDEDAAAPSSASVA